MKLNDVIMHTKWCIDCFYQHNSKIPAEFTVAGCSVCETCCKRILEESGNPLENEE